ncbi:hypothetical protein [Roseovarius ramblicola]|uniref:Uncharacterized protein n=1 Tax=Roseovarius ramblicola TaxID=2022336 RepID=A0ABV5HYQ4_9RHOB
MSRDGSDRVMFGRVGLEVHRARGHVVIHTFRRGPTGPVTHCFRLHGLDEITGALSVWEGARGEGAPDMRAALRFAADALAAPEGRSR